MDNKTYHCIVNINNNQWGDYMKNQSVLKASTACNRIPGANIARILKKFWPLYIMLIPGIIYYAIFKYYPIYGVIMAMKDFDFSKGIAGSPWADPWYKYFEIFYNSPYFTQILSNTIIISLLKIAFGFLPPIIMALILNECKTLWYKKFIQTVTYMPHFLSWIIIYGIITALFSESSGIVNKLITDMGGKPLALLVEPNLFRGMLVVSEIWQNIGWGAIIYLASITRVDPSLYEAATIDGCGRFGMIWHITIPGILSVIVMMFILRLGSIMDAGFEQIFVMYNPRVYGVADILDTWVYRTGLEQMNFSLASAVGLFKSVIGFVLVISTNKLARRWGNSVW